MSDNKQKMAAAVGAASMDDSDMEAVSRKAKADAEAKAKGKPRGEAPAGAIRVAVRSARAHYRAGRYWPAAADAGAIECEVTDEQLALLKADRELLVDELDRKR